MIRAYAARAAKQALEPIEFDPGPLGADQVEIKVTACGICHSDLSMLDNDWQMSAYPLVPGHEVIGEVVELGHNVQHLRVGQTVGLGWFSASCMHCHQCLSGDHNLCSSGLEQTIVGRHGGFAERARCHWSWAIPLPEGLDARAAGPLFCGGITVFNPIEQLDIRPTDRVGVVGIGGLGHLALKFLNKWGCEVTAFSSNASKFDELRQMGAHHIVNSREPQAISALNGKLDFILSTVNVPLAWDAYLNALGPRGRLHLVGALVEPIPVSAFSLLGGQKAISATPLGSPATTRKMLEFCARHQIAPTTEYFPMSKVNDAIEHLRAGKARYRIVLTADFH